MATDFEIFMTTEMALRRALIKKADAGGYDGDPNDGGAPANIQLAPIGSWFREETAEKWWTKTETVWEEQSGSDAAQDIVIFQPGGTEAGPVTFNAWGDLVARIANIRAAAGSTKDISIVFDDSITSPAVVPAGGPYDMERVEWVAALGQQVAVSIADGASFTGLRNFRGFITVRNLNTVSAADASWASGEIITLSENASIATVAGGQPFYDSGSLGGGGFVILRLRDGATFNQGDTGTVLDLSVVGTTLLIIASGNTAVPFSGIDGVVGTTLSTQVESIFQWAIPPGWLGTVIAPSVAFRAGVIPKPFRLAASTVPIVTFAPGEWLRFDVSGGVVAQVLPDIVGPLFTPGAFMVVSEESGSTGLTLAPFAGNTINGSASAIPVPAGSSLLLISDSVSNWQVVGEFVPSQSQRSRRFKFTAPTLGDNWVVTIPDDGMSSAIYAVSAHISNPANPAAPIISQPYDVEADRTTTTFILRTAGDVPAGTIFDIFIEDAS